MTEKFVLLENSVEVKWSTRTKTHYVKQGYDYTAIGDIFRVDVYDLPEKSKIKVLVQCPECGATRRIAWQSISGKDNTYCQSCASTIANFEDLTGQTFGRLYIVGLSERRGNRGQYYYSCKCECGNDTEVEGTSLSSGATQSCGCLQRELSSERMSQMVGELNPMWDSTITDEDRYNRHSDVGHQNWRKTVLARDGHRCVRCGSGDRLHAHHIFPYNQYVELREDVDNGVTLCDSCHSKFHAAYGVYAEDNELEEFMAEYNS